MHYSSLQSSICEAVGSREGMFLSVRELHFNTASLCTPPAMSVPDHILGDDALATVWSAMHKIGGCGSG